MEKIKQMTRNNREIIPMETSFALSLISLPLCIRLSVAITKHLIHHIFTLFKIAMIDLNQFCQKFALSLRLKRPFDEFLQRKAKNAAILHRFDERLKFSLNSRDKLVSFSCNFLRTLLAVADW